MWKKYNLILLLIVTIAFCSFRKHKHHAECSCPKPDLGDYALIELNKIYQLNNDTINTRKISIIRNFKINKKGQVIDSSIIFSRKSPSRYSCSFGKIAIDNDSLILDDNGNIIKRFHANRVVEENFYSFDNRLLETKFYSRFDGRLGTLIYYTYNNKNLLIGKKLLIGYGWKGGEHVSVSDSFYYSNRDKLIRSVTENYFFNNITNSNMINELTERITKEFNYNEQLIQITTESFDLEDKKSKSYGYRYKYENNKLVESTFFDSKISDFSIRYIYDHSNRIVERHIKDTKTDKLTNQYKIYYE